MTLRHNTNYVQYVDIAYHDNCDTPSRQTLLATYAPENHNDQPITATRSTQLLTIWVLVCFAATHKFKKQWTLTEWQQLLRPRTVNPVLPIPPEEFATHTGEREATATTHLRGIKLRHVRIRPQRIINSLAPKSGYKPTTPPPPLPWQKSISTILPEGFTSRLNLTYLANNALRIFTQAGDPEAGAYMQQVYTTGGIDHCQLPSQYERYHVTNRIIQRGDKISKAWDEVIDKARESNRVIESKLPIVPGTVVTPINVNQKFKLSSQKWKYRITCDGRYPRKEHRNIGGWSDPNDRLFSTDQIYHTCAMLIQQKAKFMSVYDYKDFFRYFPRHLNELGRNCIRWKHRDDTEYKFYYFLDDIFGHVTCPARLNLHAVTLQLLQEERIRLLTNSTHLISRRVDDTLIIHPGTATTTECELAAHAFEAVCAAADQPTQETKENKLVTKAEFDGYEINLTRFIHNPYNAYGGGIGITEHRRTHILNRLYRVTQTPSLSRSKTDSLIALIQWVCRVLPMLRPCITEWRACMYATKLDRDIVKLTTWATADIHRIISVFESGAVSTPLYHLFSITKPEGILITDASGYDYIGGYYEDDRNAKHNFYFSQKLDKAQRVCLHPLDTADTDSDCKQEFAPMSSKRYKLSTAFLELVGLYYGLVTAHKRVHNKVIKWVTDAAAAKGCWDNMKSKSPAISRLLVIIGTYCSRYRILVDAEWVSRDDNPAADALSHNDTRTFLQLLPKFHSARAVKVPGIHFRKVLDLQYISMEKS